MNHSDDISDDFPQEVFMPALDKDLESKIEELENKKHENN